MMTLAMRTSAFGSAHKSDFFVRAHGASPTGLDLSVTTSFGLEYSSTSPLSCIAYVHVDLLSGKLLICQFVFIDESALPYIIVTSLSSLKASKLRLDLWSGVEMFI